MPGYGDTHRCFQKYKKGLATTSQLSIRINEKYTNKQKHHDYLDGNYQDTREKKHFFI